MPMLRMTWSGNERHWFGGAITAEADVGHPFGAVWKRDEVDDVDLTQEVQLGSTA